MKEQGTVLDIAHGGEGAHVAFTHNTHMYAEATDKCKMKIQLRHKMRNEARKHELVEDLDLLWYT
jgi:hypothetical protein